MADLARIRLLLLPFGAVAEVLLLSVCLLIAWAIPSKASRLIGWSTGALPNLNWYTDPWKEVPRG